MRLFVAIAIPEEIGQALWALTGGLPGADWTDPESYHITLRFIGEAGRAEAEEIDEALAGLVVPSFEVALVGIDFFATAGRPRTLWTGVEPPRPLSHLARKIDRAVAATGRAPEDRTYTPHVTIARLRDASLPAVMRFVAANALFRAPAFAVDRFTLFESRQGGGGPVYVPLADYPLSAFAS